MNQFKARAAWGRLGVEFFCTACGSELLFRGDILLHAAQKCPFSDQQFWNPFAAMALGKV